MIVTLTMTNTAVYALLSRCMNWKFMQAHATFFTQLTPRHESFFNSRTRYSLFYCDRAEYLCTELAHILRQYTSRLLNEL